MRKEELQKLKVAELKAICKERNIPHYHGKNCFNKSELINAILEAEKSVQSDESAEDKNKTDDHDSVEVAAKDEKKATSTGVSVEQKMSYVEEATVGTIIAFNLPNGKTKSAKIVKKSTKNRRFMVETDYGAQYVVNYEDVVWVRTGKKWPRGVYRLLKGLVEDGAKA